MSPRSLAVPSASASSSRRGSRSGSRRGSVHEPLAPLPGFHRIDVPDGDPAHSQQPMLSMDIIASPVNAVDVQVNLALFDFPSSVLSHVTLDGL